MRNQLQNTTFFVILLISILAGALYLVEHSSLPSTYNELTTAATSAPATTTGKGDAPADCTIPLSNDASSTERKVYEENCRN